MRLLAGDQEEGREQDVTLGLSWPAGVTHHNSDNNNNHQPNPEVNRNKEKGSLSHDGALCSCWKLYSPAWELGDVTGLTAIKVGLVVVCVIRP